MPEKFQQLIDITDAPSNYTEEHISEVLHDSDTAEDYAVMVLAAQAFETQKENAANDGAPLHHAHTIMLKARSGRIRRMAAIFLALFLVSGIALAALLPIWKSKSKAPQPSTTLDTTKEVEELEQKEVPQIQIREQSATSIVVFQDETLGSILQSVCGYYQLTPVFLNDEVRQLRLYLKWKPEDGIDVFLKRLSQFEKFHVTREGETVIIDN